MAILLLREIVLLTLEYFVFEKITKIETFENNLDKSNDNMYLSIIFMRNQIYTHKVRRGYYLFNLDSPGQLMAENYYYHGGEDDSKKNNKYISNYIDIKFRYNCLKYNQDVSEREISEMTINDIGMRFLVKCENIVEYLFDWPLYKSILFEKRLRVHFQVHAE